jgi:hypothetical protein
MSHRVRRSFLVFPLAVPKLGRSRCTDTPAYMNFLNCVSNESYCSSSSRDNPVRKGKGSLDEAAIYPLPPLPKVERLYCHELAESVRNLGLPRQAGHFMCKLDTNKKHGYNKLQVRLQQSYIIKSI